MKPEDPPAIQARRFKKLPPWSTPDEVLIEWLERKVLAQAKYDPLIDKHLRRFGPTRLIARFKYKRRKDDPRYDKLDQDAEGRPTPLSTTKQRWERALAFANTGNFKAVADMTDRPEYHRKIERWTERLDELLLKPEPRDRATIEVIEAVEAKLQQLHEDRLRQYEDLQKKFPVPEVFIFMADFLRGQRPTGRRGRRASPDPFYTSSTYRAACYALLIEILLKELYPKKNGYRERAADLASIRTRIKPSAILSRLARGIKL